MFGEALSKGLDAYAGALSDADARAAIGLTVTVAAIAVPLNIVFGVTAAWCIAKFDFRGKSLLTTIIDIPFFRVSGDIGTGLCVAVRPARLVRTLAEGA